MTVINLGNMIAGICDVLDGLSAILSLGFRRSRLGWGYGCWREKRLLNQARTANRRDINKHEGARGLPITKWPRL